MDMQTDMKTNTTVDTETTQTPSLDSEESLQELATFVETGTPVNRAISMFGRVMVMATVSLVLLGGVLFIIIGSEGLLSEPVPELQGSTFTRGTPNTSTSLSSKTESPSEGMAMLTMAEGNISEALSNEGNDEVELFEEINNALNRSDPFQPVFEEGIYLDADGNQVKEEKDILEDVLFSGYIDDPESGSHVAILTVSGETLVKKMKESFSVDGHSVVLKSIKEFALHVTVDGEARSIPLEPFVDIADDPTAASTAPPPADDEEEVLTDLAE